MWRLSEYMVIGFIIWSIVAVIFLGTGISCRKSSEAVGFFSFVKPPIVENVEHYNNAVSVLWFFMAGVFEIIGFPLLILKQNSPLFIPVIFAVVILVIVMMVVYFKIEAKYRKQK